MSRRFNARGRTVDVDGPVVMGIVNASPESFSGDGSTRTDEQAALALAQFAAGADIVDLGGQSANTKTPELDPREEIDRLVPLIEAIRRKSDGLISVDTYKPSVAEACLAVGADIVNDVSALHHPELADVVARWDAAYVLMHTVGPPKVKVLDPDLYPEGVAASVADFFDRTLERLEDAGVSRSSTILDPGVDFAKTPRQSVELLHDLALFERFDQPLLLALSRKDFVGAVTDTSPRERDPGTLASIGHAIGIVPDTIFRVHQVDECRRFLDVARVLDAPEKLSETASLHLDLRLEKTVATD